MAGVIARPPDRRSTEVLVIGAGIMGLCTALEFLHAGRSVTVLERDLPGRAASWAGGGILAPLRPWAYPGAVWELVQASLALYPALCDELARETGIDAELTRSGAWFLDVATQPAARAWLQRRALDGIRQDFRGHPALFLDWVYQVRNPRLLKALAFRVVQLGGKIRPGVSALGLVQSAGRVKGAVTADGRIESETVCLCTGAWTHALCAPLGGAPVLPARGQMLAFAPAPGVLSSMVIDGDHYLVPRRDGRILAGSTVEDVGFDGTTTPEARQRLAAAAVRLLPELGTVPIEHHWAGLRPATARGVPLIGPYPGHAGLWLCAGHFRNGLAMAPASAKLLADLVLGRATDLDPAAYVVIASPPSIRPLPFAIS